MEDLQKIKSSATEQLLRKSTVESNLIANSKKQIDDFSSYDNYSSNTKVVKIIKPKHQNSYQLSPIKSQRTTHEDSEDKHPDEAIRSFLRTKLWKDFIVSDHIVNSYK